MRTFTVEIFTYASEFVFLHKCCQMSTFCSSTLCFLAALAPPTLAIVLARAIVATRRGRAVVRRTTVAAVGIRAGTHTLDRVYLVVVLSTCSFCLLFSVQLYTQAA